ncbi:hypothetical protein AAHC03_016964 [Spirometra sp. Aus1]
MLFLLYEVHILLPSRARKEKTILFSAQHLAQRCQILFSDNASNIHDESKRLIPLETNEYFRSLNEHFGKNCKNFKQKLFPTEVPITEAERAFPLAFSLSVYKDINQVARLLRLIYRPQNFYAIHVDKKSPRNFYRAVQETAKCFGDNVGVVPRSESINVKWGDYTVLEQEFVAARLLPKKVEMKVFDKFDWPGITPKDKSGISARYQSAQRV